MNPPVFDKKLFSGIPRNPNRGLRGFCTSFCVHAAVIALVLAATPDIMLRKSAPIRLNTTLIAPPEMKEVPKRLLTQVAIDVPAPEPRAPRQLAIPSQARIAVPKLDEAPALPNVPRAEVVLPLLAQPAPVRLPVQTGVFGSNLPPDANPALPVPAARSAGFDREANESTIASQPREAVRAGFDVRSTESRPVMASARIQTGGFEQTSSTGPQSARLLAKPASPAAFDMRPENDKPRTVDRMVQKTGFDEPKAVNVPARQAAPAASAMRPVEILEKPKPAYTAEARTEKIEGTVLLDVVFASTGEVRVLGVARGLGHGLDEKAIDAARRIRFHPATQLGTPVDQRVLLHVVFQITG